MEVSLQEKGQEKSFSFIEWMAFPMMVINKHIKDFLFLTVLVSFVCSVVAFLSGRSFLCGFSKGNFCSFDVISMVVSSVFFLCGLAFFINRWVFIAFEGKSFEDVVKERCWKQDFKALFLIVSYFVLWGIVGFGFYLLDSRQPVEDWRMELLFFIGVSGVMFFAIVLLVNFVIFLRFLQGKSWGLNKTFWPILDNIFKLLMLFFIYLLVFVFCLKNVISYFLPNLQLWEWFRYWGSEFFIDFFIFTAVCVFISCLKYVEIVLFSDEK